MMLENTRFGQIEYTNNDVFSLPDGLVGFPNLTQFLLVTTKPGGPFRWLQSLDDPTVAFLLAEPTHYFAEYQPLVRGAVLQTLGIEQETPRLVLTTASIPRGRPEDMTLNLAAPLLFNLENRVGAQVIIEDEAYTMKHRVFEEAPQPGQSVAA